MAPSLLAIVGIVGLSLGILLLRQSYNCSALNSLLQDMYGIRVKAQPKLMIYLQKMKIVF